MFPMRSSTYNNNSNPCSVADPENFQGGGVQPKFVLPPPSQGMVVVEDPKMEKLPLLFFFNDIQLKVKQPPLTPPPSRSATVTICIYMKQNPLQSTGDDSILYIMKARDSTFQKRTHVPI